MKERLSNFSPEELNRFIDRIRYCDNEEYAKLNEKVKTLIEEEKTKSYAANIGDTGRNSIKSIIQKSSENGKELMTFEQVWEIEQGVEFNPEAIQQYENSAAEYTMASVMTNKANAVKDLLKDSMVLVKGNNQNGVSANIRENGEKQLEVNLLNALTTLYGDDEEKINAQLEKLSGGSVSYKDGQIIYNEFSKNNKGYCLLNTAQKLLDNLDERVDKALGGKTVEDYKNSMASAYEQAYGRKNAQQLAQAYVSDQEAVVGKVRMCVELTGTAVMVGGMFFFPPAAFTGAITASFGGIGVEALNEASKKGEMSDEVKQKIKEEILTNAALFAVGGAAGKAGSAAKAALIAKKCPTIVACASDIGLDATISLLGDMALTGEIDLAGEGLSQLMSLLAGHIKAGKFKKKSTNKTESNLADNNTPVYKNNSTNEPLNVNQIKTKLGCNDSTSETIINIINSKPELKDKLVTFLNSKRPVSQIQELLSMATKENIDDLINLSKNKSLIINVDINGNVVQNDFADIIKIAENNPQYAKQLMDIAANSNRNASDIKKISEYTQKYLNMQMIS